MANSQIEKLLSVAKGEIGTKESPAGSDNVKYNTEYYGQAVKSTAHTKYYWCVVFVWWCFKCAGLSGLFHGGGRVARCAVVKEYAQQNGQWVTGGYQRGDVLLFNFKGGTAPQHIGICESVTKTKVTTIDGNTSAGDAGSQDNGGMVNRRTRSISTVVGAYRPKYSTVPEPIKHAKVNTPVLSLGMENASVRALQAILNAAGYPCGDIDGSYGPQTEAAVKAFQRAAGLPMDGKCGTSTWARLLGGVS